MNQTENAPRRIESVDALRGFAVMAIMFLHNIEHFNFYVFPENDPTWLARINTGVWDTLFFLFAGKAYAIFALLFGFSFYIQNKGQEDRGNDFRGRFAWRLVLLLGFGFLNAVFFPGDVLVLYAIVGFSLIPVCKWSNKQLLALAIVFMLQPVEWGKVIYAMQHPDWAGATSRASYYFGQVYPALYGDSFIETVKANFYDGQMASITWGWENGRFFQTSALFMLGLLIGRKSLFKINEESRRFWIKALIVAAVVVYPLYWFKDNTALFAEGVAQLKALNVIALSWRNFASMVILVSLFMLAFSYAKTRNALEVFVPYGKMSLTNYITQSIVGSVIYYGYGFAMYQHLGITLSFLTGVVLFIAQLQWCKWWLARYKQGPLEYVWKKATWMKFGKEETQTSNI